MRLEMLNDTRELGELLNFILDERHYMDDDSFNKDLTFSVNYAATQINTIIKHDAYLFEKVDDIYKLKGLGKDPVSVDAHFDNIQNQIIQEIRQAKYLNWVAVAWFTDKVLFKEVCKAV